MEFLGTRIWVSQVVLLSISISSKVPGAQLLTKTEGSWWPYRRRSHPKECRLPYLLCLRPALPFRSPSRRAWKRQGLGRDESSQRSCGTKSERYGDEHDGMKTLGVEGNGPSLK